MSNVSIVSEGTAQTTKVMCGDKEVTGVTKIEISEIVPGEAVEATITLIAVRLGEVLVDSESNG